MFIALELSERKENILSAIIERFILTGEPVGSKFLAATLPLTVSSATIRNEMAFLAEKGYLDQPHTSAGRIPSDKGYRYYIDKLLHNFAPSDSDVFRILSHIDHSEGDSDRILSQVAEVLAELTGCAVIATTPDAEGSVIKNIQIIPVSKKTAMTVVTTSSGALKSRIARLEKEPDYSLLEIFYSTAAANFIGRPLTEINTATIQSVASSLGQTALELTPLLAAFYDCIKACTDTDFIVKGHSNLLNSEELRNHAVDMIELFGDSDALKNMLKFRSDSPVELRIGTENIFSCMRNAAVIKAVYEVNGSRGGMIAVAGPTKMDYSRIIPLVKYISGITGQLLTEAITA